MSKIIKRVPVLLLALFYTTNAKSQNDKLGTWNILNAEYYLNKKWNVWVEGQLRTQKFVDDIYYHQMKGGFSYKLNKTTVFLFGAGQYATYSNGGNFKSPAISHEFRMWEQLTLTSNISRLKIEHKYRAEQRWFNRIYRNTFRYRFNPIVPINKHVIEKGTIYASVFNEVFMTNKAPYFERNRIFLGLGFMINDPLTVQAGFFRQFDYSLSNPGTRKDFIQTSVSFRLNQHKGEPSPHSIPAD
ncbi:MAG: hypothetical protein JWQ40_836 [Segetibacter sp.]|nr:hypothetical protein [Segetibacter sp.]